MILIVTCLNDNVPVKKKKKKKYDDMDIMTTVKTTVEEIDLMVTPQLTIMVLKRRIGEN